ncbi:Anthocyanidin 5,3-O-glucosyltransferase [Hordeum vulgare]|uniref:Glycosyltransferase n=1 Tax=Hordeum vulgare subsp. vulgare TaxID=112509 RepID=A0A287GRI5_HORVV|nr:UDP-glycosyltransferase 88A1-like [Hordeum vulgare subsp. vulgare]KAE8781417.1 Anthocyanidin 5,3-O-glucosyltransferase [Hordeum vulgare]
MHRMEMKQTVVMYPGAGVGHVGPMTELGSVFVNHGYDVTVVLVEPPFKSTDSAATAIERMAASNPSISFHVLPSIPAPDFAGSSKHPFLLMLQLLHDYNERLEAFLRGVPRKSLHSVVLDMFCVHATDVCVKLGVPVYTFYAGGASSLSALTQLPALIAGRQTGLKKLGDTPLDFLGVPPMPASHLIKELLEHPEDEMCKAMVDVWKRNTETMGVLVNTFESLESRAVQSLKDPSCVCVPGRKLPPIYCVGPLVGKGGAKDDDDAERNECLGWLDAQPDGSVVFLCFGSMGTLSTEQLKEMAVGLERSGQRFLWSVREPAGSNSPKKYLEVRPEPDLDALLPQGFLDRTKGRGLIVKSWAPQVDVLRHRATGAFVTHCGWNSVLEAVAAGVPMLCLPLEAEQKMNKVCMTEDMGVAVELEGYMAGFVEAEEVEAKVRLVIEGGDGRQLRARVAARREEAKAALEEDGSSRTSFAQFLLDVDNLGKQLDE